MTTNFYEDMLNAIQFGNPDMVPTYSRFLKGLFEDGIFTEQQYLVLCFELFKLEELK